MNREPDKINDLFFTCSLIELLSRKTNNQKKDIIGKLGKETISKIYNLASVYHSENIEKVVEDFIEIYHIDNGFYDVTSKIKNRIPTHFELGRIYTRLILDVNSNEKEYVETLIEVLSSWIILKLDNYDSSLYYESPEYIFKCYKAGKIL